MLRGLDGTFVKMPKHDEYVLDKVGALKFFIKGFVPINFIETDEVKLLKKDEHAELYDVIGDKYANKILDVATNKDEFDEPIYTSVPLDSFVLDKFELTGLGASGFTTAICAYLDSLQYRTVGEVVFVHENFEAELDNRVWLKADGTQSYAVGFYPEVADVFERAQFSTIISDAYPTMTSNTAPAPYTTERSGVHTATTYEQ